MIFINNALRKIGNEGLIVNLKANNFYEGDFAQLYEVFKYNENMNLTNSQKTCATPPQETGQDRQDCRSRENRNVTYCQCICLQA